MEHLEFVDCVLWLTMGFLAFSLLALTGIIGRRAFLTWRAKQDATRIHQLTDRVLEYLESPEGSQNLADELQKSDHRIFIQLFQNLIQNVRGDYAQKLVELMRKLGIVDEYLVAMKAYVPWRRAEACMALVWFHEPRVIQALETSLDDPRYEVRVEAARSLVKLRAISSVANLITKLAVEDEAHPLTVIDLFRNLGPGAVPELISVIEGDTKESAKRLAIEAMGYSGDLGTVETLLKLYQHPSADLRLSVIQALGLLGDPRSSETVRKALTDPSWEVRTQAAVCSARLGLQEAIPGLEKQLNDEQWWVRYEAAEALFKLGDDGLSSLRTACKSLTPRVTEIARAVLHEKGLMIS